MSRCLKPVARRVGVALTQNWGGGDAVGNGGGRLPVAEAELLAETCPFPGCAGNSCLAIEYFSAFERH